MGEKIRVDELTLQPTCEPDGAGSLSSLRRDDRMFALALLLRNRECCWLLKIWGKQQYRSGVVGTDSAEAALPLSRVLHSLQALV